MSYAQHQRDSAGISLGCSIITLSDTRTEQTDTSGAAIRRLLVEASHRVARYQVIPDDPQKLDPLLSELLADVQTEVILTTGGTGISRRDQTMSVLERRIETPLPGFGELFRMLSWQEIGSGAMLSRAAGGVAGGKLLFAMPGSTKAVELAMSKLILPELRHLSHELKKQT